MKIADFGISKRARDGLTVLRTQTGTPAFAAPEVLGLTPPDDKTNGSYTAAVDIWSLGVIAYFMLTGETLFKEQWRLVQYVLVDLQFPMASLLAKGSVHQGVISYSVRWRLSLEIVLWRRIVFNMTGDYLLLEIVLIQNLKGTLAQESYAVT